MSPNIKAGLVSIHDTFLNRALPLGAYLSTATRAEAVDVQLLEADLFSKPLVILFSTFIRYTCIAASSTRTPISQFAIRNHKLPGA